MKSFVYDFLGLESLILLEFGCRIEKRFVLKIIRLYTHFKQTIIKQ